MVGVVTIFPFNGQRVRLFLLSSSLGICSFVTLLDIIRLLEMSDYRGPLELLAYVLVSLVLPPTNLILIAVLYFCGRELFSGMKMCGRFPSIIGCAAAMLVLFHGVLLLVLFDMSINTTY